MARTTGPRFVAETLRGYGVSHVFFVPQMLLETLTGMEGMGIRVEQPAQMAPAIEKALAARRPVVIDTVTD